MVERNSVLQRSHIKHYTNFALLLGWNTPWCGRYQVLWLQPTTSSSVFFWHILSERGSAESLCTLCEISHHVWVFFLKTVVLLLLSACCSAAKGYHSSIRFKIYSVHLLHKLSSILFSASWSLIDIPFLELLSMSISPSLRNCFIWWFTNSSPYLQQYMVLILILHALGFSPISIVTCSLSKSGL